MNFSGPLFSLRFVSRLIFTGHYKFSRIFVARKMRSGAIARPSGTSKPIIRYPSLQPRQQSQPRSGPVREKPQTRQAEYDDRYTTRRALGLRPTPSGAAKKTCTVRRRLQKACMQRGGWVEGNLHQTTLRFARDRPKAPTSKKGTRGKRNGTSPKRDFRGRCVTTCAQASLVDKEACVACSPTDWLAQSSQPATAPGST